MLGSGYYHGDEDSHDLCFKELAIYQGNRNVNKFRCCVLFVLAEQIAEAPDITWGGQGNLFRSVILRPKGSQEEGEENVLGRGKSVCWM